MSYSRIAFLATISLIWLSCSKQESSAPAGPRTVFSLSDRQIDLEKFLKAFPYDSFRRMGSLKHGTFYMLKNEGSDIRFVKFALPKTGEAPTELSSGVLVPNANVNKALSFNWKIRKSDGSLFISKDENNDEKFNLYRLDDKIGALIKLTQVAYVTGYNFSPDESKIAYLARVEPGEKSRVELHILDLTTNEDKVIATDDETTNFSWSNVAWSPDASRIAVKVVTNYQRNKTDLAVVSVTGTREQKPRVVTETKDRPNSDVVEKWLDANTVLFRSNEDGPTNLYSVNVDTKEKIKLTDLKADIESVEGITVEGKAQYALTSGSAKGGTVLRFDPETRQTHELFRSTEDLTLVDKEGDSVIMSASGHAGPFNVFRLTLKGTEPVNPEPLVVLGDLTKELVHCKAEEIRYKTFDDLTYVVEGETIRGEILATLYTPTKPAPDAERKGLVRSFYGGSLYFDEDAQLLCQMGYTVLSPAARGDASISSEYEKLNDGELGGKEIIDVIYGAKFLQEKTGIPTERIGAFGHSHGGYATQRLLTFPGKIGEVEAQFAWGFGLANAGFCDIARQTETSNIPGWSFKEAGDPANPEARAKMDDRSPINHVDKLKARLLLVHGEEDRRVPIAGSQRLLEKAKELGKGDLITMVTIPAAGHAPVSYEDQLRYYGAWLEFLSK